MKKILIKNSIIPLWNRNAKIGFIATLLFFGLLIDGCNDCNVNGEIDNTPGDIVYSSIPLNLDRHSIFTVDKDGKDLKEHIQNAKIYSCPDNNDRIAYLNYDENGMKNVIVSDILGRDRINAISGNYYPDVDIPVISPDGNYIAFYGGDSRLLLNRIDHGYSSIVSEGFDADFIPTFSTDEKYLAYFDKVDGNLVFNISETENTESIIYQKEFSYINPEFQVYNTISVNATTNKAIFSISNSYTSSIIGIFDFSTLDYIEYDIEKPFILNPILINDETRTIYTGSDGNLWINEFDEENYVPIKLTDVSEDNFCTYVNYNFEDNLILYIQISKSAYSGRILKVLDVEDKEEKILCNQVFMGFWLDNTIN